jgi:hypothetical protein
LVRRKAVGGLLEGRTHDEMPARVQNRLPDKKERLAIMERVKAMIAKGSATESLGFV